MMDATHFNTPEHRALSLPLEEGSQRCLSGGFNVVGPQMESPVWHHHNHNCFFQGNFVSPMIQPEGRTWVEQFGNNIGTAICLMHGTAVCLMPNCPVIPGFQGRSIGSDSFQIGSMCGHQDSISRNPVIVFHPPALYHQHQHLQPVLTMQHHNYSHHSQPPAASYCPPTNNLFHYGIPNASREDVDSAPSVSIHFPSSVSEDSYGPQHCLPQAFTDNHDEYARILSAQATFCASAIFLIRACHLATPCTWYSIAIMCHCDFGLEFQ